MEFWHLELFDEIYYNLGLFSAPFRTSGKGNDKKVLTSSASTLSCVPIDSNRLLGEKSNLAYFPSQGGRLM